MLVNSRHMTTSFSSTCLVMINSDSVQDSFWSNHKDVTNNTTYEHLRQLLLNIMKPARPYIVYKQGFSQLETCLIMIKSDTVQDLFWSNHKDVSNGITYEHLRQLLLNNETMQLDPSLQAGYSQLGKNEVDMCLEFTNITIPTLFHCFLQHPFLH